jgi:hypothetical protein
MPGPGQASGEHDNGSSQEAAVRALILAAPINPDNTPHGYNWTFAFPMLLFIVIAAVLYALLARPHRRVPARGISLPARSSKLSPGAARSASVAGGLNVAAGGGTTESQLEPHGAHAVATGATEAVDTTPETDDAGTGATATGATATGATATGATATGDTATGDTGAGGGPPEGDAPAAGDEKSGE